MTAKKTTESNAWPVTTTPGSPPADLDAIRADIARTRATLADTAAALAAKADARVRTARSQATIVVKALAALVVVMVAVRGAIAVSRRRRARRS